MKMKRILFSNKKIQEMASTIVYEHCQKQDTKVKKKQKIWSNIFNSIIFTTENCNMKASGSKK